MNDIVCKNLIIRIWSGAYIILAFLCVGNVLVTNVCITVLSLKLGLQYHLVLVVYCIILNKTSSDISQIQMRLRIHLEALSLKSNYPKLKHFGPAPSFLMLPSTIKGSSGLPSASTPFALSNSSSWKPGLTMILEATLSMCLSIIFALPQEFTSLLF